MAGSEFPQQTNKLKIHRILLPDQQGAIFAASTSASHAPTRRSQPRRRCGHPSIVQPHQMIFIHCSTNPPESRVPECMYHAVWTDTRSAKAPSVCASNSKFTHLTTARNPSSIFHPMNEYICIRYTWNNESDCKYHSILLSVGYVLLCKICPVTRTPRHFVHLPTPTSFVSIEVNCYFITIKIYMRWRSFIQLFYDFPHNTFFPVSSLRFI